MSPRGKHTISDQRARLGDDIIEAIECLKSMSEIVFDDRTDIRQMEKLLLDLQRRAEQLEDS